MVSLKSSKFYGYPLNFGKSQSVVPNKFPIILSQLNDPNFPKDWNPDFTKKAGRPLLISICARPKNMCGINSSHAMGKLHGIHGLWSIPKWESLQWICKCLWRDWWPSNMTHMKVVFQNPNRILISWPSNMSGFPVVRPVRVASFGTTPGWRTGTFLRISSRLDNRIAYDTCNTTSTR